MTSPMHRHARSGSGGTNMKKPNTKAAAQRLAQVMAHQSTENNSDEEDDLLYDYTPANVSSIGLGAGGRAAAARPRSPMSIRTSVAERPTPTRTSASNRTSQPVNYADQQSPPAWSLIGSRAPSSATSFDQQPPSDRLSLGSRAPPAIGIRATQSINDVEQQPSAASRTPKSAPCTEQLLPSARSNSAAKLSQSREQSARYLFSQRSCQSPRSTEQAQPPYSRSGSGIRTSHSVGSLEQPSSARSTAAARLNLGVKPVAMVPPSVPLTYRPTLSGPGDLQHEPDVKDLRSSLDMGSMKFRESSNQHSTSALQGELDMLQEENENLLEKLRFAEERFEESEMRGRQLEKQVASLGEGVSMESRLLAKKEAALQEREAAIKAVQQTFGGKGEEIISFQMEVEEEVFLKRCWLSRYWSLCVDHDVLSEIAAARHEYWSSFAPLPVEVVLAAGQNAKYENSFEEREKVPRDLNEEGNVESMLLVEKGLRELTSLKVEHAIALAMARKRCTSPLKSGLTEELKIPIEDQSFTETFELSKEESDDVLFKQAWLAYFWRRAKNHGLEPEIAEERVQFWISQGAQALTSHDAVNVERGLVEIRKLGIENQLWEESRKMIDLESTNKSEIAFNF